MKITLIGRPGKDVEKGDSVIIGMQSTKVPALPKGLPTPPSTPTNYVVFIARKQWARVSEAIENLEDMLIVEGFPALDPQAEKHRGVRDQCDDQAAPGSQTPSRKRLNSGTWLAARRQGNEH